MAARFNGLASNTRGASDAGLRFVTYSLLPATEADARELVPRLRAADRAEVLALGAEPIDGLLESLRAGNAWTARADGEIICMTGVGPLTSIGQTGVPWLLGSDLVRQHAKHFMGESRRFVGEWLKTYPILQNRVPSNYAATLRWARWLGFKIAPAGRFQEIRLEAPWHGIHQTTMAELWGHENFERLLIEYAAESAVDGLPPPRGKLENYLQLEGTGLLHAFKALRFGALVGFVVVLAPELPHYSRLVAVTESIFVARRHRKSGAGLRLLRRAEARARDLGSPGLLICAPLGGQLVEVLPRAGYAETNRVFFKRLSDG